MPASGQTFSLSPSTQTVAVGVNATITITVQDLSIAQSNPPATTQYYSLWDGTGMGVFTPSFGTVLAGVQFGTFTYSNTNPGTYTIYVTEVSSMVTHTVTVIVTAGSPPSPTSFTLAPATQSTTPSVATGDYTIELFNGADPAVAGGGGQAFALTSSDGAGTFSTGATATVPAGSSSVTFTYTSPNVGTAILTATASGSPYSVNVHTALAVITASGGSGGSGGIHMGNPQSGRSSIVGLGMESSFRVAPLTLLSGVVYNAGITGSNPMRFFTVEPGGGYADGTTKEVGVDEQDGDSSIHRTTLTGKVYAGKDTAKLDPENFYYPGLGWFGRDVETTLAAGAYKHVLTPTVRHMPSFVMEEQYGDASSGRLSTGVIIPGLHITHAAILQWQADYYAHRQIPNRYANSTQVDTDYDFTSVAGLLPSQLGGDHTKQIKLNLAPTSVDVAEGNCGNGPLVHANMRYGTASGFGSTFVTLNDVAIDARIQPGWVLDLVRDVESHMSGGSGFDPTDPVGNVVNVSGKMDFLFTDNTIAAANLSNCKFGINMQYVGAQIGATGYYYSYEVYLPRVKLLNAPVTRMGKTMMLNATFQAEKDSVLGFEVKVTLQNAYTHATLSGGSATYGGGGLGGWDSV